MGGRPRLPVNASTGAPQSTQSPADFQVFACATLCSSAIGKALSVPPLALGLVGRSIRLVRSDSGCLCEWPVPRPRAVETAPRAALVQLEPLGPGTSARPTVGPMRIRRDWWTSGPRSSVPRRRGPWWGRHRRLDLERCRRDVARAGTGRPSFELRRPWIDRVRWLRNETHEAAESVLELGPLGIRVERQANDPVARPPASRIEWEYSSSDRSQRPVPGCRGEYRRSSRRPVRNRGRSPPGVPLERLLGQFLAGSGSLGLDHDLSACRRHRG